MTFHNDDLDFTQVPSHELHARADRMGIQYPVWKAIMAELATRNEPTDAQVDAWNDGALDGYRGKAKASDAAAYLEGYAHGVEQRQVRPVMPARPEGYYHSALEAE